MGFFSKRKEKVMTYDRSRLAPAIRKSICTGEETFGFIDIRDGHFTDIQLLNDEKEKAEVLRQWNVGSEPGRTSIHGAVVLDFSGHEKKRRRGTR